jgi:hypothetical protein
MTPRTQISSLSFALLFRADCTFWVQKIGIQLFVRRCKSAPHDFH